MLDNDGNRGSAMAIVRAREDTIAIALAAWRSTDALAASASAREGKAMTQYCMNELEREKLGHSVV
eukprot:2302432-Pleurochrysis_carterae.AAC.1